MMCKQISQSQQAKRDQAGGKQSGHRASNLLDRRSTLRDEEPVSPSKVVDRCTALSSPTFRRTV